jgi:hypothetical protein
MTAAKLLADLRRVGVVLSVKGERLTFDAPAGALTADLKDAMRRHKPELIGLLKRGTVYVNPTATAADLRAVDDLFGATPRLPWHRLVEAMKQWRRDEQPDEYERLEREAIQQEGNSLKTPVGHSNAEKSPHQSNGERRNERGLTDDPSENRTRQNASHGDGRART